MEVLAIIIFVLGVGALCGSVYWLISQAFKHRAVPVRAARKLASAMRLPHKRTPFRNPLGRHEQITFLIPFRTDHGHRARVWEWLYHYYRFYFPDAEFIESSNADTPFCKTRAVNDGFKRSRGDVIVMMDADCFIEPYVIRDAVKKIRRARSQGRKLWFIPYRRFYRLTEEATRDAMKYSPTHPGYLGDPPEPDDYTPLTPGSVSAGHWFGALIQIYPVEAFVAANGMDERFSGWGGEDVSFMHAVDTLWAKHKTMNQPVWHFWHPSLPGRWKGTRQWAGQLSPEQNDWLSTKYEEAVGDPSKMKGLVSGNSG